MSNQFAKLLGMKSYVDLVNFIRNSHAEWSALPDPKARFSEYAPEILAQKNNLEKLSSDALLELWETMQQDPVVSSRIILCAAKSQISDLRPGDTIITPNGVSQIQMDYQELAILSQSEMTKSLPIGLLPKPDTVLTIYNSGDTTDPSAQSLTNGLNQAIAQNTNALYLGATESEILEHTTAILRELRQKYIEPEISKRQPYEHLFKALKVQSDIGLIHRGESLTKEYIQYKDRHNRAKTKKSGEVDAIGADALKPYIIANLTKTCRLSSFSDKQLRRLKQEGSVYMPHASTRIIIASSVDQIENSDVIVRAGDTVFLSDDVRQVQFNQQGSYTMLRKDEIHQLISPKFIPNEHSEITTIDLGKFASSQIQLIETIHTFRKHNNNLSSLRTLICADLAQLEHLDPELSPGDVLIMPDGVFQIQDNGETLEIIAEKEMKNIIAPEWLPGDDTELSIIDDIAGNTVSKIQLIDILNTALQNKPSSLCICDQDGAKMNCAQDIASNLVYLAEQELLRRDIKRQGNLILNVLDLKTDAEFMQYYKRSLPSYYTAPTEHLDPYTEYFTEITTSLRPKKENFAKLSDAQLNTLITQCDAWAPTLSTRIIRSSTLPQNYQIGDTLILPEGIYQMRETSAGKIKQELILRKRDIPSDIAALMYTPVTGLDAIVEDDYKDPDVAKLIQALNPYILRNPKGMYLSKIAERANESYGTVNFALKAMAEQELHARALNRFHPEPRTFKSMLGFPKFSLWSKTNQAVSTTRTNTDLGKSNPPPSKKKRTLKELKQAASNMLTLKKKLISQPSFTAPKTGLGFNTTMLIHSSPTVQSEQSERTLDHVQQELTDVALDLEVTLNQPYRTIPSQDGHTIQVLQQDTLVMEASTDNVSVYKPLLQVDLEPRIKAELFLQALGIPPTHGREKIEVHGGHHALRKAIRTVFNEYKEKEYLQESASDTASETSSDSEKNMKRKS